MNFVIAFPGEAQPIIEFYELQKVSSQPFAYYQKDNHKLVISAMGREQTSQAVNFLKTKNVSPNQAWMNLGIAGHGSLEIGQTFIAGKIEDDLSENCFYPPQIYDHDFPVTCLKTCSQPSSSYEPALGYDMEAHAFYAAVVGASTRELTQVIKVVSDNPSSPLSQFSPKDVPGLIEPNLKGIALFVEQMEKISLEMQQEPEVSNTYEKVLGMHHFSSTRSHQLHDLVRQANALELSLGEIESIAQSAKDGAQVISDIKHWMEPNRQLR